MAGDDMMDKLHNLILAMEEGNLDRLIANLDEAIGKCDEREKKAGKDDKVVLAEDF